MSGQEFLSLAQSVVVEHYQNPDFDISTFALIMGISRVHLSRQLKRLTGRNASCYLREQRLRIAARRLRDEPETSITEIAFDAGFSSHAYFSQCFCQLFGTTPSEWRT